MKYLDAFVNSFLSLIYPPLCLHCRAGVEKFDDSFCQTCFSLLTVIDPKEQCPICFSSEFQPANRLCSKCHRNQPVLNRIASVFDYEGPACSLVKQLKYGNSPHLAQGCGAYLAAQFIQLDWPMPDLIVPVPVTWIRLMDRGYNQSLLLSNSLAEILQVPVVNLLERKSGDYSQASLSSFQRTKLQKSSFSLKPGFDIYDKKILLIDDVMTTSTTLNRCGEVLFAGLPNSVYGLTLCKAL